MIPRELARAARRVNSVQASKLAALPSGTHVRATVLSVATGAGSDGNALLTVKWRGAEVPISDYPDNYTPAVGHRVLCVLIDGELSLLHHGIGYP